MSRAAATVMARAAAIVTVTAVVVDILGMTAATAVAATVTAIATATVTPGEAAAAAAIVTGETTTETAEGTAGTVGPTAILAVRLLRAVAAAVATAARTPACTVQVALQLEDTAAQLRRSRTLQTRTVAASAAAAVRRHRLRRPCHRSRAGRPRTAARRTAVTIEIDIKEAVCRRWRSRIRCEKAHQNHHQIIDFREQRYFPRCKACALALLWRSGAHSRRTRKNIARKHRHPVGAVAGSVLFSRWSLSPHLSWRSRG